MKSISVTLKQKTNLTAHRRKAVRFFISGGNNLMKTNIFKRCTSLVLALIICISSFAGLGTTAFASGVKGKSYMAVSYTHLDVYKRQV